jgi:hypothetical protein
MCPEYERHEREIHLDLSTFEIMPGTEKTGSYPRIDHSKAVKKYHRPAAGNEQPLPSDVRPPHVLEMTINYLIEKVLDDTDHYAFSDIHNYFRDRSRSIRQDFTLQNIRDETCVKLHEKIARFHIFSGHRLCEEDPSVFDTFQNTEQLRKVLQSLHEFYDDANKNQTNGSYKYENEPEFRCYYILSHLRDPDIFRKSLNFHPDVFHSDAVQFALECCAAYIENNYVKMFKLVSLAPYLCGCLLFSHFKVFRENAVEVMSKVYLSNDAFPIKDFGEILGFEDAQDAINFCNNYGIQLNDDYTMLKFSKEQQLNDQGEYKLRRADRLIESKNKLKNSDIVNGQKFHVQIEDPIERAQRLKEKKIKETMALDNPIYEEIEAKILKGFVSEVAKKVYSEEYEKELQYKRNLSETISSWFVNSVISEFVNIATNAVAKQIYAEKRREEFEKAISEYSQAYIDQKVVEQVVNTELKDLVLDEMAVALFRDIRTRRCFRKWRIFFLAFRQWKKLLMIEKQKRDMVVQNLKMISLYPNPQKFLTSQEPSREDNATNLFASLHIKSKDAAFKCLDLVSIFKNQTLYVYHNDPIQYLSLYLITDFENKSSFYAKWILSKFRILEKNKMEYFNRKHQVRVSVKTKKQGESLERSEERACTFKIITTTRVFKSVDEVSSYISSFESVKRLIIIWISFDTIINLENVLMLKVNPMLMFNDVLVWGQELEVFLGDVSARIVQKPLLNRTVIGHLVQKEMFRVTSPMSRKLLDSEIKRVLFANPISDLHITYFKIFSCYFNSFVDLMEEFTRAVDNDAIKFDQFKLPELTILERDIYRYKTKALTDLDFTARYSIPRL